MQFAVGLPTIVMDTSLLYLMSLLLRQQVEGAWRLSELLMLQLLNETFILTSSSRN
jgi:hypothetical protein